MITVLRFGHRPDRDKRITTHVALTARAFGADSIIISTPDEKLQSNVESVVRRFGGPFRIETGTPWRKVMTEFDGQIVHLTMYGETVETGLEKLDPDTDVLVVVGSTKVPREIYERADINIGVGNQPHSEVAALAVFLDRLTKGEGLKREFTDYEMKVLPDPQGKTVVQGEWIPEREECLDLLEELGVEQDVIEHILAVTDLSVKVGQRMKDAGHTIDDAVLLAGSLLHDIGRAETHDIQHAVRGAEILRSRNVSTKVVNIVRNHIGAGLDTEEAKELGLPDGDYTPMTLEQKVLAASDNLFAGSRRIPLEEELSDLKKKDLEHVAVKVKVLHEELSKLCGTDLDEI